MQDTVAITASPHKSLRVLITNNTLDSFAGTERYVLDLAIALKKRGHFPVAYSSQLGRVTAHLREAGIVVLDDLNELGEPPDIIHGHHHLETMTALLHFPNTPAIYYCHGWFPWEEAPLKFPRILRYVAVDDLSEERLIGYGGITQKNIVRLRSVFDLDKFKRRMSFSPTPKRALIFNNAVTEKDFALFKTACLQSGIETVDGLGITLGQTHSKPEEILPHYDLVFACGRSAFEALATGAAVVSAIGKGVMITPENVVEQSWANFGWSGRCADSTVETIMAQIKQYDATHCERVCDIVQKIIDKEQSIAKIVNLYKEVITEFQDLSKPDILLEYRAASAYFRHLKKEILRSWQPPVVPATPAFVPLPPPPQPPPPPPPTILTRIKGRINRTLKRIFNS